MTHKRKGQLTVSIEWARHLRKTMKRFFWKRERLEEKIEIKKELEERE